MFVPILLPTSIETSTGYGCYPDFSSRRTNISLNLEDNSRRFAVGIEARVFDLKTGAAP